ncbi:hypothetical protein J7M22_06225 [Candidatus Poribacteria bacterium]|nr:hypothetical protein [Candidatus Poribacteria bacterium]
MYCAKSGFKARVAIQVAMCSALAITMNPSNVTGAVTPATGMAVSPVCAA